MGEHGRRLRDCIAGNGIDLHAHAEDGFVGEAKLTSLLHVMHEVTPTSTRILAIDHPAGEGSYSRDEVENLGGESQGSRCADQCLFERCTKAHSSTPTDHRLLEGKETISDRTPESSSKPSVCLEQASTYRLSAGSCNNSIGQAHIATRITTQPL